MTKTERTTDELPYGTLTIEVRNHHGWFLVSGIIMVLLGIAAITFPFVATLAVELFIGWVLVISGVASIMHAFRVTQWKGFLFTLLGALLSLGLGVLLLLYPMTGILSLTLLITIFFIVGGIFRIFLALMVRPFDHWVWLLTGGGLALLLAALILIQWPEAAAWVIGLLLGIDLIFSGWTLIMLATAARASSY